LHELGGWGNQLARQAERERQFPRLKRSKANRRIDRLFEICSGVFAATSSMSIPPAAEA